MIEGKSPTLESEILNMLGMAANDDYTIYDLETRSRIYIYSKALKTHIDGVYPFITNNDILFQPLFDLKLMKYLFQYRLDLLGKMGEYYPFYYFEYNKNNSACLVIKDEDGDIAFRTRYYTNEILRYIEALYLLNYENADFSLLDFRIVE